ncbi:MAG TPA: hypothetical protein VNM14_07100 [Planctomycetota bacterium]|nr:hypothetical protein [Planctomycetota bacterium]
MIPSHEIQAVLDRVKSRYRRFTLAGAAAGLAAVLLLAIAVEVALDQLFSLPRWFRILTLLGGLSSAGWLGYRLLSGPWSGRVSDLFAARSIEGQYGHLKSGLITYVQLSSDGEEPAALRELVGERVAQDIGAVRPEIVVPSRELRRRSLFLGGALGFGLLLFAISPSGFWLSFRRSLLPIRNLSETRIVQVVPGDGTTYKGKDLEIAIRLDGKLPPSAQLRVSRPSSDPQTYELPARGEGWYRCILPGVTEGFTYSFRANDVQSDDYRIRVAEVPRLKSLAATLRFPKYTGFPVRTQDSGNLDVIEGTEATLEGCATRPLRSAALILNGRKIASPGVHGDRFSVSLPLLESFDYAVELVDKDGNADPEPSKFRVVVRKDAPPQVTITLPGKNVELAEPQPVHLAYRVVDDFGLSALRLTAKVNGRNPKGLTLPTPKERLTAAETTLDLKALGAGPGDYVEYFLTATDNKDPGPQSADSATYVITIQSSLPLLTFADQHPDVRLEKYRDPWDRKGSVESRTDRLRADDRSKDNGLTQDPAKRETGKKDVVKLQEKKPDATKLDPASEEARKAEPEGGREDALSKLLDEKKDLIERLLAKAGGKDAGGDAARQTGKQGADTKGGDGREDGADAKDGADKAGSAPDSSGLESPEGKGRLARDGESKRSGRTGTPGKSREGKNAGRGGAAEGGDAQGAGENAEDGTGGEAGGETAKSDGAGRDPSVPGKPGKPGTSGKAGKPGRGGNGEGGGEGDSEGDDDATADGDDEDDYDLAQLFPFGNPGGT